MVAMAGWLSGGPETLKSFDEIFYLGVLLVDVGNDGWGRD